jgi:hypothetical protein
MSEAQPVRSLFLVAGIVACVAGWTVAAGAQSAPPDVPTLPAALPTPQPPPFVLTPPPLYTPQPGTVTPSPAATPAGTPVATPIPAPVQTPSPGATVSPYHFVYTPPTPVPLNATDPPAAPLILEIDLTDKVLHAPGPLNIRVLTSPLVATVTMHALGRDLQLPKTGDGLFSVDNQLPSVPFWLHGKTYDVDFIAAVPDGRNMKVTIPVTLR